MADPILGEIRTFAFNFTPTGWAPCHGQLLPINQNQALFALLGTTYGGNGQTTFALPNFRGRVPVHVGQGLSLGEAAGTSAVTINTSTMAQHIHFLQGTTVADTNTNLGTLPNNLLANTVANLYASPAALVAMDPTSLTNVGGSQPHENRQPFLVLSFCIALQGIFPSQN
jgi:microcystin-dependent protein